MVVELVKGGLRCRCFVSSFILSIAFIVYNNANIICFKLQFDDKIENCSNKSVKIIFFNRNHQLGIIIY